MWLKYKNPKEVKGLFTLVVTSKFLSQLSLRTKLNTKLGDPELLQKLIRKYGNDKFYFESKGKIKNQFFVWVSRIKEWGNQKNVKVKYNIQPTNTYKDEENENIIDFFDFSDKLNGEFQLTTNFTLKNYETRLKINSGKIEEYNKKSFLYKRYTISEKYLEQTNQIKKLAKEITIKERNYFEKARRIFDWVRENITYQYPPAQRGVIPTLKNRSGDCGEFNLLFVTLCRSVGIPARCVSGMWVIDGQAFHSWAEFYLEDVGWLPVDCTASQGLKKDKKFINFMKKIKNPLDPEYYFGNLDSKRIIFSKGSNILLKNCPGKLSRFKMMENCRSLFMQPTSTYPFCSGKSKGIFIIQMNSRLTIP
ncbi:MAG: transglutaminase-like domain-containing protein [Candidatus Aenigmarchaeota archaeon]|nr:transglutaminase-like domain-containing protein [Candidatus Aenigmarchaeota archaeon]